VLGELAHVVGAGSAGEEAAVDGRVQRLHAAIEHLWEARDLRDAGDGKPRLAQDSLRVARRDELPAEAGESARELGEACLVVRG
jgi:hypothetical protein